MKTEITKDEYGLFELHFESRTFTVRDGGNVDGSKRWNTRNAISSADAAVAPLRAIFEQLDADKEHFVILALNNKNRPNGHKVISTGSLTASLVHPREVFRAALFLDAAGLILCHNHPSGDPAPSPEDIDITRRLKEIADVMGIRLLDHVILGEGRFFSFQEKGML